MSKNHEFRELLDLLNAVDGTSRKGRIIETGMAGKTGAANRRVENRYAATIVSVMSKRRQEAHGRTEPEAVS
jgi:hypothetical protein